MNILKQLNSACYLKLVDQNLIVLILILSPTQRHAADNISNLWDAFLMMESIISQV